MVADKHKKIYFFSVGLSEVARTFPHAILTIILLNKGIAIEQIAVLQIFYMIAIIVSEFPTGILSDLYNRKFVYLGSIILSIIAYWLIYFSTSIFMLYFCWFIYGMSAGFMTGTIDVSFTALYKDNHVKLKSFMSEWNIVLNVSAIAGGYIGSILYSSIDVRIYWVSIFLYALSGFFAIVFIPNDKNPEYQNRSFTSYMKTFISDIYKLLKSRLLIELFLLISAIQFFIQPFYQYWQAFFIEKKIPVFFFGGMYAVYRITGIIASFLFKFVKLTNRNSYIVLGLIAILTFLTMLEVHYAVILLLTPIILVLLYTYSLNLNYYLRENVDSEVMGTITAVTSTISRLFSVLVLLISSILVKYFSVSFMLISLTAVFSVISIIVIRLFTDSTMQK